MRIRALWVRQMTRITGLRTIDDRLPTGQALDGSRAMNPAPGGCWIGPGTGTGAVQHKHVLHPCVTATTACIPPAASGVFIGIAAHRFGAA